MGLSLVVQTCCASRLGIGLGRSLFATLPHVYQLSRCRIGQPALQYVRNTRNLLTLDLVSSEPRQHSGTLKTSGTEHWNIYIYIYVTVRLVVAPVAAQLCFWVDWAVNAFPHSLEVPGSHPSNANVEVV